MVRTAMNILLVSAFLSGCSGPIETRVQTHKAAAIADQSSFTFGEKPAQSNALYDTAQDLVTRILQSKNMRSDPGGTALIVMSIAERPANITITAGEKDRQTEIAMHKKKKFLQSCEDIEHRLSISILSQADGANLYSGSATEYHCKGALVDSLPHLVNAAFSGFDAAASDSPVQSVQTRQGLE